MGQVTETEHPQDPARHDLSTGTGSVDGGPGDRPVRTVADDYVRACTVLDPGLATQLGTDPLADGLPSLTPEAADDLAALQRSTLADLDALEAAGRVRDDVAAERRCAALLRERLGAALAAHAAGEHLRSLGNLFSPVQQVRSAVVLLPGATAEQLGVAVRRVARVEQAYAEYGATLLAGVARGLPGGPAQVHAVIEQLDAWAAVGDGRGWYAHHLAGLAEGCGEEVPADLRAQADAAGESAQRGVLALRALLAERYLPAVDGTPDAVGRERYLVGARRWTGSDIDPEEAYAWGWRDLAGIRARMVEVAEQVLPGSTPREAMDHLEEHGEAVDGVEQVRERLQQMMDTAVAELDGSTSTSRPRSAGSRR